ncbi:hypothetical protein [Schinkia azotoformans]|uniref:hypothetical protein n=1 Tax=Schinkia azotoformans TaxID=1454 RepID=UPI002DBCCCAC|nr:hypothetical protein [Schinkia azotoformans]MEC1716406.1 hypothetical protein [Schinkia azotoformans]MEC1746949.1 hypothetical protein [Schinkia azotoformans]MEC1758679.1 hypothetical protein [Schinkia azotoformans]MED4377893.1 hypothetical protein [Schinkia azotoformans]
MKRRTIILLITFLIVSCFVLLYLYRGNYWISLSQLYIDEQVSYNIPVHYKISDVLTLNQNLLVTRINNLRFEHDFGKPFIKEDIELNSGTYVEFPDGKKMICKSVEKGELSGWGILNDERKELLSQVYGSDLIKDDYRLLLKTLKLTPDDFKWYSLDSNKELEAKLLLYDIKMALPNNSYNIYSFQTEKIRGFQRGKIGDRDIILHIFDSENKQENGNEILLVGNFSQEEIDIMLQTMEFLDD